MPNGFTIDAQAQTQELGPSGNLIDVIQIVAVSEPEGYEITVRVPLAAGWPDRAREKIEERLAEMRSLAG